MIILEDKEQKIILHILSNLHSDFHFWNNAEEIDYDKQAYDELLKLQERLNSWNGNNFSLDEILKALSHFNI